MCIIDVMNNVTANKKLHVKHEEREKELWEEDVQLAIDVQLLNKKWKLSSTVVDPLCFLSNVFIADVMVNDYFVTLMGLRHRQLSAPQTKISENLGFRIVHGVYKHSIIS